MTTAAHIVSPANILKPQLIMSNVTNAREATPCMKMVNVLIVKSLAKPAGLIIGVLAALMAIT